MSNDVTLKAVVNDISGTFQDASKSRCILCWDSTIGLNPPPPKKIWLLKRRKFIGYPQKHPQVGPGCRLAMVIWQVAVGHQHQLIFAIQVMGFLADLKPIYPQFVFWNQGKGENQIQPSRLQIIALHALPQAPLV